MKNKHQKSSEKTVQQQTESSTAARESGTSNQMPELFGFMQCIAASMEETAAQLVTMNSTMSGLQSEVQELRRRIDAAMNDLDDARNRLQETSRALAALTKEVAELKTENLKLKSNIAASKIIIHGIPDNCDANVTLKKIAALLDVSFSDHQIANIYRINVRDKEKQKPIVISFNSVLARNHFLANRKKRIILCSDIGLNDNKRKIYINEYLTKETLCLLNYAKLLKREHEFDFVWPKNGIIYARKNTNENCIRIEKIEDVALIIGKN
jgi:outer membrane murein-binding lipoprotein Lpp